MRAPRQRFKCSIQVRPSEWLAAWAREYSFLNTFPVIPHFFFTHICITLWRLKVGMAHVSCQNLFQNMSTMSQNFGISIFIYRNCFDPSDTFWTKKHLNCHKICGLLMRLTRRCTKMELATHLRLQFWHPGNYLVTIIVSEIARNKFTSISL